MPFVKGKSGNPSGRPKVAAEFRDKCRRVVDALCIQAWEAEVEGKGEDWLRASELLAAYGYGRPSKAEGDGETEAPRLPEGLTLDELRAIARTAKQAESDDAAH